MAKTAEESSPESKPNLKAFDGVIKRPPRDATAEQAAELTPARIASERRVAAEKAV